MKRKIITKKQLDRLVSLGVVKKDNNGYLYDGCYLFYEFMYHDLIGLSVSVEKNGDTFDNECFPFKTKEENPWLIPAFILSCNYKKMLAKADEVRE